MTKHKPPMAQRVMLIWDDEVNDFVHPDEHSQKKDAKKKAQKKDSNG